MKKASILAISSIFALMFSITACGEKVSNNLGGATRGNNGYNYPYNSMGNNGNNGLGFDANSSTNGNNVNGNNGGTNANGAGYWDNYGITNGITNSGMNDGIGNGFVNNYGYASPYYPNTAYNATDNIGNTNTTLDSATIAD